MVGCDSGYTFGVTLRITIRLRIRDRARVIKGELASGSRLTLGANGGCTRRGGRARGGVLVVMTVLVARWMYSWCWV